MQSQLEVNTHPATTFEELNAALREGRALTRTAVESLGLRMFASKTHHTLPIPFSTQRLSGAQRDNPTSRTRRTERFSRTRGE